MLTINGVADKPNELADNLFKVISECPFEKNKDVSGWNDAAMLYDLVIRNTFGIASSKIISKSIFIEEPVVTETIDLNSYLVVDLLVEVHNENSRLNYKFPISY